MSFHSPIDDFQLLKAKTVYKGLRKNLRLLRRDFAPSTANELRIIRRYESLIRQFGEELVRPRAKIRAERLNDLDNETVRIFAEYSDVFED